MLKYIYVLLTQSGKMPIGIIDSKELLFTFYDREMSSRYCTSLAVYILCTWIFLFNECEMFKDKFVGMHRNSWKTLQSREREMWREKKLACNMNIYDILNEQM